MSSDSLYIIQIGTLLLYILYPLYKKHIADRFMDGYGSLRQIYLDSDEQEAIKEAENFIVFTNGQGNLSNNIQDLLNIINRLEYEINRR